MLLATPLFEEWSDVLNHDYDSHAIRALAHETDHNDAENTGNTMGTKVSDRKHQAHTKHTKQHTKQHVAHAYPTHMNRLAYCVFHILILCISSWEVIHIGIMVSDSNHAHVSVEVSVVMCDVM